MTHYGLPLTHATNWELHIPALTVDPNSYYNNSENGGQLKMLHLTDTHMDLYYTPGASSVCGESTCCRPTSYGHNHSAGVWAETRYLCDVGLPFAEQAIRHMGAEHPDLDFVIWTGDNVPHDEFNSTQQQDLENNRLIASVVKSTFGQKRVFPCLGNHDTHPFNQYIPYEIDVKSSGQHSMSWLYKTLADDYWSQWINTAKAKESFKIGGYYSAMATDRIKVVILNNNICQHRNWWLAYDPVDPDGQLKWLIDELYAAELNKQTAIIIGHIPPYQTKVCYTAWASNYFRIMVRFQHLIVGQYYGHTHLDEIVVFYDKNRTTNQTYPISHGYIGSSVTTWPAVNPGYRIFTLDETGKPLDFTTYYSNITQDNIDGKQIVPKWQIAYTAKQSYQLSELSKEAWDAFITRADTDQKLTDLYFSHLHRFTDAYIENMRNRGQYNPKYIHNLLQSRKYM
ncbi:sphingomyelin phosphodiesterase-like [Oppia nitens]|uniref:sphingomyelin phosphodiesterase-like n=1 Tax=Oppia nitens TaxID=1686743 RepID=UPI0023DBA4B5|nr:sphingomyelin phosphodiesterase-like [Oppia nitens]